MEKVEITPELIAKFQSSEGVELADLIQAFNPATASSIPETLVDLMPHLTGEQIQALAAAYPNKPTGNSYLVLKDKNFKGRQSYPRSTWENLSNLRRIGGEAAKGWVALNFSSRFNQAKPTTGTAIKSSSVQDISKDEITSLPGIVSGQQQQVTEQGAGQQAATGIAETGTQQAHQQPAPTNTPEGAENANVQGSEFPEVTVEQIKSDLAAGAGNEETTTSGRTVTSKTAKTGNKK